jgi:hypothetical protein
MAYNIGEKPGKGSYVCPNCGCRLGEMTAIARRDLTSLGTDLIVPATGSAPRARQTTYTVNNSKPRSAKLKTGALVLLLAGVMFASGFATKALLSTETSIESPGASGAKPSSGQTSLNVNSANTSISSVDESVSAGNPTVTVWVNTKSGVYHCPNTRWYGNTKNGQYMTQKEAQSKGYRPAYKSACG